MSLLEVNDINVYYGAIHAIKGISFSVDEGEVVTLIGANGAGKSTTLNTVAGLHPLRRQGSGAHPRVGYGEARHGALPRRTAHLPADDGAGEPRNGRLHAPRQGDSGQH